MDIDSLRANYPDGMSILPNTYGRIGVFFGSPSFKKEGSGSVSDNPVIGISGFYTKIRHYNSDNDICMLIIGFKPTGLQRMFNFPLSEFNNQNISLKDLFPFEYEELMERLFAVNSWKKRVALIESYLFRKIGDKSTYRELDQIIHYLFQSKEAKSLKDISSHFYLTERTMRRRFINGIGISPKLFSKLVRFQKALKLIAGAQKLNLGTIALELGYYDQAHFIHEFTEFYGHSPKNFMKEKRSVLGKYYDKNNGMSQNANLAYV